MPSSHTNINTIPLCPSYTKYIIGCNFVQRSECNHAKQRRNYGVCSISRKLCKNWGRTPNTGHQGVPKFTPRTSVKMATGPGGPNSRRYVGARLGLRPRCPIRIFDEEYPMNKRKLNDVLLCIKYAGPSRAPTYLRELGPPGPVAIEYK